MSPLIPAILCALLTFAAGPVAWQDTAKTPPLPFVISAALPRYPPIAVQARVEGDVRLLVATDGERVVSSQVVRGNALFNDAAIENLRTWRFEPHSPTQFEASVVFKLDSQPLFHADYPTRVVISKVTEPYVSTIYDLAPTYGPTDVFEKIYGVSVVMNSQTQMMDVPTWPFGDQPRPKKKPKPATVPAVTDRPMRITETAALGYPIAAREKGIDGLVRVVVASDGTMPQVDGPPELIAPTLVALRDWRINPPSRPQEIRINYVLLPGDCTSGGPHLDIRLDPPVVNISAPRMVPCGR